MVLEHYIKDLLYRYNCVVIPGFGAFLAQKQSARLQEDSNTFYAPSKLISFNEQLSSNDGLLISYIAELKKVPYEKTLIEVENVAKTWKDNLLKGEKLNLEDIGVLSLSVEEKIQFEPFDNENYLTSSFGFTTFSSTPVTREVLKEEVEILEERIPFIITPEKRKESSFRSYYKYAAIALLALSTGLTGFKFYENNKEKNQLVQQEAQEEVSKYIQKATFFDAVPMELPTINLDVITKANKKENQSLHHIVAGAFRFKKNADRKIRQLKRLGYHADYIGTNKHGLHMVTYDRYEDVDQALSALRKIKRVQSKDAWLLSLK